MKLRKDDFIASKFREFTRESYMYKLNFKAYSILLLYVFILSLNLRESIELQKDRGLDTCILEHKTGFRLLTETSQSPNILVLIEILYLNMKNTVVESTTSNVNYFQFDAYNIQLLKNE